MCVPSLVTHTHASGRGLMRNMFCTNREQSHELRVKVRAPLGLWAMKSYSAWSTGWCDNAIHACVLVHNADRYARCTDNERFLCVRDCSAAVLLNNQHRIERLPPTQTAAQTFGDRVRVRTVRNWLESRRTHVCTAQSQPKQTGVIFTGNWLSATLWPSPCDPDHS